MEIASKNFDERWKVKDDLSRKSARGWASIFSSQVACYGLRVAAMMVLARLLTPEDFGIVGMVAGVVMVAERFKDFGLDIATVQKSQISQEEVSALFWINGAVGSVIALLVACLSPIFVWFFGDSRLFGISLALSTVFLFSGLSIQHQALLRRKMRFTELAAINLIAIGSSVGAGLFLAWEGWGYWALVHKEVVRAVVATGSMWLVCRWIPSWPGNWKCVRDSLRIGGDVTGFNLVYFASRSFDQILIGKFRGAVPLGLYRQANQLLLLPMNLLHFPVDFVAMPALSRLKAKHAQYRQYYSTVVSALALVSMPLAVYLGVFAREVILLALGDQWIGSVPIFRVLAMAAFIVPVWSTAGTVMISTGRSRAYFWWGLAHALVLVTAFSLGVTWGAMGVAISYVVVTYLTLLPSLWYGFRKSPVNLTLFFRSIREAIAGSLVTAFVLTWFCHSLDGLNPAIKLFFGLILAVTVYGICLLAMPEGRRRLRQLISFSLLFVGRESSLP